MPRGVKRQPQEQPQLQAPQAAKPRAAEKKEISIHPTALRHVFYMDVNDDGILREIALVKKWEDGSISYVDIALCDNIDKGRLKKVVTGHHADKYQLWELLDMERLSNGINGLDYFHQMTRMKRMPGTSVNTVFGGGLANVRAESNQMVGSGFTDTASGTMSDTIASHPPQKIQ